MDVKKLLDSKLKVNTCSFCLCEDRVIYLHNFKYDKKDYTKYFCINCILKVFGTMFNKFSKKTFKECENIINELVKSNG